MSHRCNKHLLSVGGCSEEQQRCREEGAAGDAEILANPQYAKCIADMQHAKEKQLQLQEDAKNASADGDLALVQESYDQMQQTMTEITGLQQQMQDFMENGVEAEGEDLGCLHSLVRVV